MEREVILLRITNTPPAQVHMILNKAIVVKKDNPKYSISKSERQPLQSKSVIRNPGPGQYNIPSKFVESAKFSFGIKHKDLNSSVLSDKAPGPGYYSPDKLKKNDAKFSFGIKSNIELRNSRDLPGPGKYNNTSFLSETHGVGAFGTDKKLKDFMSKTLMSNPGPGAYNSTNDKAVSRVKRDPTTKFGTSLRISENKTALANPGPGSYTIDRDLGAYAPKYSLSPKRESDITRVKKIPGPGSYNPNNSITVKASPGIRFGRSQRISVDVGKSNRKKLDKNNNLPGPFDTARPIIDDHKDFNSRRKNSPSVGFGSSTRPNLTRPKDIPGPGEYALPSLISEGPGFKMGVRVNTKKASEVPGPGQYEPSIDLLRKSMPKFGMGSSPRYPSSKTDKLPGPGSYDSQAVRKLNPKAYKFGSEARERRVIDNGPGPGSYKIPTKIIEAPKYLLPKTDEQFAYV